MSSSVLLRPKSLLELPDRKILDVPLLAVATFSFVGESAYGELSYNKDDRILIFCEDMSEGWSLGMLVDDEGNELEDSTGDTAEGRPAITKSRGLIARGFYKVSPFILNQEGSSGVSLMFCVQVY